MVDIEFKYERPSWMDSPPRPPGPKIKGEIVAEVGVHEERDSGEYWKAFERVRRKDDDALVRLAYYKPSGNSYKEAKHPATLPPDILNDLYHQARQAGIFRSRRAEDD